MGDSSNPIEFLREDIHKLSEVLEKVESRLDSMDRILVKQEENLRHHIYRTELAERAIERMEKELGPIKKHVNMADAFMKILGAVATGTTIILGIIKLMKG